jgi:sporulation protein YlmC with PRC-barrel domain
MAPLAAQGEEPRKVAPPAVHQDKDFRAQDQVALSEVLGAKVRLKAKAEERAEATAEGRAPKGPNGSVDDLVIDCRSGQASWAIVSVGGLLGIGDKEAAVPASSLLLVRTADAKPMYELDATEAELKSLPAFDKKVTEKSGLDVSLQNAETNWKKIRPDARLRPVDASAGTGKPDAGASHPNAVMASKLKGLNLRCSDGKEAKACGEIDQVAYDVNSNTVTYVVIGKGGVLGVGETNYLIPYRATKIITVENKPVLTVAKSSTEVESSTRYAKPEKGFLAADNAKGSCTWWGVDHK